MAFLKGSTYVAGDLFCEGKVLIEEQAGDDSTIVKFEKGSWTVNRIPYCSSTTGRIGYSFFDIDTPTGINNLKLVNQNDFALSMAEMELIKVRKNSGSSYDLYALANINPMATITNATDKAPKVEVKGDLYILDKNLVLNPDTNLWEFA